MDLQDLERKKENRNWYFSATKKMWTNRFALVNKRGEIVLLAVTVDYCVPFCLLCAVSSEKKRFPNSRTFSYTFRSLNCKFSSVYSFTFFKEYFVVQIEIQVIWFHVKQNRFGFDVERNTWVRRPWKLKARWNRIQWVFIPTCAI